MRWAANPQPSDWVARLFADADATGVRRVTGEPRSFLEPDDEDPFERFRQISHFESLFRAAIEASGLTTPDEPHLVVFGSGDGINAVAPCLRLFRGARIVAADRTDAQFPRLAHQLRESGAADRVVYLQAAPDSDGLPTARFDLVVGISVLHRLFDPDAALANALRVLRPGGHAIFMEPFDGYGLIRLAFERICQEARLRRETLATAVEAALVATAEGIGARTMPDRSRPEFAELAEKWLFSRESLTAGARLIGFREIRFVPHNDHPTLYRDVAGVLLRAQGVDPAALPDWAVDVLDGFDRALPPPVKRLLMLEGTIILTK